MYELTILLDETKRQPLYEQIYCHIKEEIRRKRLKAGTKLPSTRTLAENLSVSRSTTQLAYDQLLAEGYIEAIPCKGCFVASLDGLLDMEKEPEPGLAAPLPKEEKNTIICSPRGIDLEQFPYNTWRKLCRTTLIDNNKEMFAAGHPQGEDSLREAIREYLHAARGVNCSKHAIVIGAGNGYLLTLLYQILQLSSPRSVIAMENPTYKQAWRVFSSCGAEVVPVGMDESGMALRPLRESGANIAYVMPSHQFPTGIAMPIRRRMELLSWAQEEANRYIIEDDYDSEFRYRGKSIPALQGVDGHDKVIYIGTFSKAIAPGIRVGYMVLPKPLLREYQVHLSFYECTVSRMNQQILASFLGEGYFERHLNRMRGIYRRKHEVLIEELEQFRNEFQICGENAGLHLLLTSKKGISEERLISLAKENGVRVYKMSEYFIGDSLKGYENTVLLGFANLTEENIREGVNRLKKAWLNETLKKAWG